MKQRTKVLMLKRINIWLFLVLIAVMGPVQSRDDTDQAFSKFLSQCTAKTGYDPNNSEITDEYTLAKGERDFLDCAYTGIETNIIPESYIPDQYKNLIKAHRQWTIEVEKRLLTRAKRKSRTLSLIGVLKKNDERQKELLIDKMVNTRDVMKEDMRRRELDRLMQPRINYSAMRGALR